MKKALLCALALLVSVSAITGCSDDEVTPGETIVLEKAVESPTPNIGQIEVPLDATLSWSAVDGAGDFRVHFGDNLDDVASASASTGGAEASDTSFTPEGPLEEDTTYFWRVDAVLEGVTIQGPVWSFRTVTPDVIDAELPGAVSGPAPAQGAQDVATNLAELAWDAAENADTYDVYFSSDLAQVVSSDSAAQLAAAQGETTVSLDDTLEEGTTYFWRVDATNADGTTHGPVWTFDTTAPIPLPLPQDFDLAAPEVDAQDVERQPTLAWDASADADTYSVFLSADPLDVITADEAGDAFQGNINDTELTLAQELDFGQTVFWRVIAQNDQGTASSPVGRFTTIAPVQLAAPISPSPANLAEDILPDTALAWEAGPQEEGQELGTVSYDIYFGQDFAEVSAADRDSDAFVGNQAETALTFEEPLEFDTNYFWRVDAINESGATASPVWTFRTETQTDAPNFQGIQSVSALDAAAVRVTWDNARDDRDLADGIVYDVFVATERGGQDFETPTASVNGPQTSITLTGDQIADAAAAGQIHVVVRARDSEGTSNQNTVEISAPIINNLPTVFVDPAAPDGGDGSVGQPINDLTLAGPLVEDGGTLLLAGGAYDNASLDIGSGPDDLIILGGFAPFADLAENTPEAILNSRDPRANPTVINSGDEDPFNEELGIFETQNDHTIDGVGRWVHIDGITFEDESTRTLEIVTAGNVTLSQNRFVGPELLNFDFENLENERFYDVNPDNFDDGLGNLANDAAIHLLHPIEGEGELSTINVVMVGNDFQGGNGGLRCIGPVSNVHAAGNRVADAENSLLLGARIQSFQINNEFTPENVDAGWVIPPGGLNIELEENRVRRGRNGLSNLVFQTQVEDAPTTLQIRAHRNHAQGIRRGDTFTFEHVGLTGPGGQATAIFTQNTNIGISRSMLSMRHGQFLDLFEIDPENEQLERVGETIVTQGSLELRILNNDILHTNDNAMELNNAVAGDDGTIDIEFAHNRVGPTESEGLDINSSSIFNDSDEEITPTLGTNSTTRVHIHDNHFDSVDEFVELNLAHTPNGQIEARIVDNVSLRDNGDCIDIDIDNWIEEPAVQGIPSNYDVLVAHNHCETEDDFAELRFEATAGDASVVIEDNSSIAEQGGLDLRQEWPDTFNFDQPRLVEAQPGTSRVLVQRNRFLGDTDGIEGSWYEVRADSQYVFINNDVQSLDDPAMDVNVYSVGTTIIANNDLRSYDEGVVELFGSNGYDGGTFTDPETDLTQALIHEELNWPMDLIIWNNDTHVGIRENIEVNWDMRGNEGNVYIAQNDAWGNTESEALDVVLSSGAAGLLERNIAGFNDVDSSPAIDLRCQDTYELIVRNNIAVWGAGDGIQANRCVLHMENNTTAFNGREGRDEFGMSLARYILNGETRVAVDNFFDIQPNTIAYGQSHVMAALNVFNNNRDITPGLERSHNWSLISESTNDNDGFDVIVGDPMLEFCGDRSRDFRACFVPRPESPAIDAGPPQERYNDLDGTRNDIGHTGGPHAGPMGYQGESIPVPQVAMGLRPLSALSSGARPLPLDATLSVVFTRPLGDNFDPNLFTVVDTATDEAVDGTWVANGNRATFTPGADLPGGTRLEVTVAPGVGSDAEQVSDRAHIFEAFTAAATEPEAEPNNEVGQAQALEGHANISGSLNPFTLDASDVYRLNVTRGQRLRATLFASRNNVFDLVNSAQVPVPLRLVILDSDAQTILDMDVDSVSDTNERDPNSDSFPSTPNNSDTIRKVFDPYINHVFQNDGIIYVRVEADPELLPFVEDEEFNPEEFETAYDLLITLQ